jgi:hypothetical protein
MAEVDADDLLDWLDDEGADPGDVTQLPIETRRWFRSRRRWRWLPT